MTYERLAYDDQDSTVKMHLDCTACAAAIRLPAPILSPDLVAEVPPISYDAFPREVPKPEITISDATAHLASRLHLHLD
jgi:hypothetical protein